MVCSPNMVVVVEMVPEPPCAEALSSHMVMRSRSPSARVREVGVADHVFAAEVVVHSPEDWLVALSTMVEMTVPSPEHRSIISAGAMFAEVVVRSRPHIRTLITLEMVTAFSGGEYQETGVPSDPLAWSVIWYGEVSEDWQYLTMVAGLPPCTKSASHLVSEPAVTAASAAFSVRNRDVNEANCSGSVMSI